MQADVVETFLSWHFKKVYRSAQKKEYPLLPHAEEDSEDTSITRHNLHSSPPVFSLLRP